MTSTTRPERVTLRAYQVGFGDCFLLTFHYPAGAGDRHLLIDFGTTARPDAAPGDLMQRVARSVKETCQRGGGRLHAVVATHRHADHISGFTRGQAEDSPGNIIRSCKPLYVVQPWTEDPAAAADATGPAAPKGAHPFSAARFAQSLDHMHEVAHSIAEEAGRLGGPAGRCPIRGVGVSPGVIEQLGLLGANNAGVKDPSNKDAVDNLAEMGEENIYTYHGDPVAKRELERLLPGVEVHVLGPPTLDQPRAVLRQRVADDEEYWHLYGAGEGAAPRGGKRRVADLLGLYAKNRTRFWETARLGRAEFWQLRVADGAEFWKMQAPSCQPGQAAGGRAPSDLAAQGSPQAAPAHARWFIQRMNSVRGEQLLEMVRTLDRVLNNTSLILLFVVGDQKLLFPGDAQWENWAYALADERNVKATAELLDGVNVYKVGHHGSLNATPKRLWKMIRPPSKGGLRSVVSTRAHKHGDPREGTEVPRTKLVEELKTHSTYFSTQQLKWGEEAVEESFYKDISHKPKYPNARAARKPAGGPAARKRARGGKS